MSGTEAFLFRSSGLDSRSHSNTRCYATAASEFTQEAVNAFKKAYPNPRPGGNVDLDAATLKSRFASLSKTLKGEENAIVAVRNVPEVLLINSALIKANFDVFEKKFGEEKAIGLVQRNPNILSVPTKGYGSAEVAGDETIVMSYVLNATRPIGKPLLAILFLALAKPVIFYLLGQ